jgi:hypothetical protein
MTTPQRLVHDALWACLEGHPSFAAAVKEGNRIKEYSGIDQPELFGGMDSNFPSTRVVFTGIRNHVADDSSHTRAWFQIAIQVATADQQEDEMADVSWYVQCALENWADYLTDLAFFNEPDMVKDVRCIPSDTTLSNDQTRGLKSWATVWRGEALCQWLINDMIYAAEGGT